MGIKRLKRGKFQLTYTNDGVKKRISFSTKKEAEIFKANIRVRRFTEHLFDRVTIEQAIEAFFESKKTVPHNFRLAFERFKDHLLNHKEARLVFIDEVRRTHVLSLRQRLLKIPLSPSSVNLYVRIYRGFFNHCLNHEWVRMNPLAGLESLAQSHEKKKLWQTWQQKTLIDCFSGWMGESLYFFWLTGIRPSSIFRLRWKDFNSHKGSMLATSFKSRGGAKVETNHYLPPQLVVLLNRKREADKARGLGGDMDFIFHENGKQKSSTSFCQTAAYMIKRLQKDDDSFSGLTIYSFRHTFVSRLGDEFGISIASKAIGHKSVITTEKFYYSEDQQQIEKAVHESTETLNRKLKLVEGI